MKNQYYSLIFRVVRKGDADKKPECSYAGVFSVLEQRNSQLRSGEKKLCSGR